MTVGVAAGFLMGGAAGDWLFLRFPNASRPFINQLSMAVAGPLAVVLFKAMPGALLMPWECWWTTLSVCSRTSCTQSCSPRGLQLGALHSQPPLKL